MTGNDGEMTNASATTGASSRQDDYDPFARGQYPVGVRTIEVPDTVRGYRFPCEVWYPADARHAGQDLDLTNQDAFTDAPGEATRRQQAVRDAVARPGTYPFVVFSHSSGGGRRQSTFLCTHLGSHGYVVAALEHSERVNPALARRDGETAEQRAARAAAWIANRVPDVRLLLDHLLGGAALDGGATLDAARVGLVGHSFGGWTVLATPEADNRIHALVALAPGGSYQTPPGMIPAQLTFVWGGDIPTLYLVAADDSALPLSGMYELCERTPATKRMVILRHADHEHFADEFEQRAGLYAPAQAHLAVRGLTLCHLDATLRQHLPARQFWLGDVEAALAARGVAVVSVQAPTTRQG
jgi:dienelactone hydrolase